MKSRIACLAMLILLVPSVPAYGFLDANLSLVVNLDGLKDAAQSIDRLLTLVDELSNTDPNKGRLVILLAGVKRDVNDMIKNAADTLKQTGKDISKDLVEKYLIVHDKAAIPGEGWTAVNDRVWRIRFS
jgi:hypothetical protein